MTLLLALLLPSEALALSVRPCVAGDHGVPAAVVGASMGPVTIAAQPSGSSVTINWSVSTGQYWLYNDATDPTRILVYSNGSPAGYRRCVAIEDPTGELLYLDLRTTVQNDVIRLKDPVNPALPLHPTGADLHIYARARRGQDMVEVGPSVAAGTWISLVGGHEHDLLASASAQRTCIVGPEMPTPDWAGVYATEEERWEANCRWTTPIGYIDDGDMMDGGSGNDIILGGDLSDIAYGNGGDDRIELNGGDDTAQGGSGGDLILGGSGSNTLHGDQGDDDITGGELVDHILGGDGDDILDGQGDADYMYGDAGDDQLLGGLGDDTMEGGQGQDDLLGQEGDDDMLGGDDNDLLCGGGQNDIYGGEGGDDRLVHPLPTGPDEVPLMSSAGPESGNTCSDFSHDQDGLGLYPFGIFPWALVLPAMGTDQCSPTEPTDPAGVAAICGP